MKTSNAFLNCWTAISLAILFVLSAPRLSAQPTTPPPLFPSADTLTAEDDLTTISRIELKKDSIPLAKPFKAKKRHSPLTATLLSAAIPGAGQVYNRKYWKVPIVLGAIGGMGAVTIVNANTFSDYRKAYIYRTDSDANTVDTQFAEFSDSQIQSAKNISQRNLELAAIGLSALYVFNIIDAFVDAHLFHFDISDNLSLSIAPMPTGVGLSVAWKSPQKKLLTTQF